MVRERCRGYGRDPSGSGARALDAHLPSPYSENDAREFLAFSERGLDDGNFFGFAIVAIDGGRLLGGCSVRIDESGRIGEVGYYIRADARRKGFGAYALRLLSQWALEEFGLARLQLIVIVGNTASAGLAEAAGFRLEGALRSWIDNRGVSADALMFSLLPGELPDDGWA